MSETERPKRGYEHDKGEREESERIDGSHGIEKMWRPDAWPEPPSERPQDRPPSQEQDEKK